ncbi:MAG: hypothetical protein C0593_01380 [Marinilabiliales bacterium]|nr:MAG: hypothetical protein C0593_01380 [Marinilabiliales bacterium]
MKRNITNIVLLILLCISASNLDAQNVSHWRIGNPYVSRCDAAFSLNPDYASLISNRNILFEPMVQGVGLESIANFIPANVFPREYSSKPVSAAMDLNEEAFILFKGDVYVTVSKATLEPLSNVAKWIGWPGFWKNDIDAAIHWPDGAYIFIKGLQYVSYDPNTRQTSRPNQMNRWAGWPSTWTGSIDAAFNGYDGYIYFIRKGEILAMDANTMGFAPGYPRKLAGTKAGISMVGSNTWANQQAPDNNTDLNMEVVNVNASNWCAIGEPDPSMAPAEGKTIPILTDLAGGDSGESFIKKLSRGTRISEIRVWTLNTIKGIEFVLKSPEGRITETGPIGSTLGTEDVYELLPGECIIGVKGTYGGTSKELIQTICFMTNKGESPVFGGLAGKKGDQEFMFEIPIEGSFYGIHGKHDSRDLVALGVVFMIYEETWIDFTTNQRMSSTGDLSAWNTGIASPEDNAGPADPYFDNHRNAVRKNMEGFAVTTFNAAPDWKNIGKSIDITKIDPFDFSKTPAKDFPIHAALEMIPSDLHFGGPANIWYLPHGTNEQRSSNISRGHATNTVTMVKSYNSYSREFGVSVAGSVGVAGMAAGSASASYRNKKTTEIGSERMMAFYTSQTISHSVSFDLDWQERDEETGKAIKKRQLLTIDFREAINKLTVPSRPITEIPISRVRKNGNLPEYLSRFKDQYYSIIEEFGTHYLNDVVFGGYYTKYTFITKEMVSNSNMSEYGVKTHVEGQIKAISASADLAIDVKTEEIKKYENYNLHLEERTSGGKGASDYDVWKEQVIDFPSLIQYTIYPMSDLLTEVFFPFDKDIEKKKKILDIVVNQYLVDHSYEIDHPSEEFAIRYGGPNDLSGTEDEEVTIKVELTHIKVNEGDGEESNPKLELYGNVEFGVYSDSQSIWQKAIMSSGEGGPYMGVESYKWIGLYPLNLKHTFTTTAKELANIKVSVWGKATDHDPTIMDKDDLIFDVQKDNPGKVVLMGLRKPGDSMEILIKHNTTDFKGTATWIKK